MATIQPLMVDPSGPRTERVPKNTVQYTNPRGRLMLAPPGETVELLDAEIPWLEEHDSLEPLGTTPDEVAERPAGELTGVAPETSDAEMLNWVRDATVQDVSAYLQDNPEEAQRVLDAETKARDGKPRAGVVKACELAAGHVSQ
jgi:hypothetical protein